MRVAGHEHNVMSASEVELVHRSALRILENVGMEIQNERLLGVLADFGLPVDLQEQRVRFPPRAVEQYIAEADKYDWQNAAPHASGNVGVYHGLYHNPFSGRLEPWTEESLAFYFALPGHLEHVGPAHMLGCRLPVPGALEPLYERYYCWKYGVGEGGSIYTDEQCPYVLDVYRALAEDRGVSIDEVFHATVYLVPPLKLGRHEAYQVEYFWERGLQVGIGDMYAMGATAPVTLAGAVTLNLAEQLGLCMVNWALFGTKRLRIGSSLAPLDMRTTIYPYGRPEMAITNLMTLQMARHYGAACSGHAGLSDAKLPSVEAGAQKALTAIPTLLANGRVSLAAGLLSVDEVCSPIQMVLDDEFVGALGQFTEEFEVSEETIGLDTILAVGPGGHFLDAAHTARHFRHEQWQPGIWSRHMVGSWLEAGSRLDVDVARDKVLQAHADWRRRGTEGSCMSPSLEQAVLGIIQEATHALVRA